MCAGMDASGIPEQSRSGRFVRSDGRRPIRGTLIGDLGRVHLRQTQIVAYANSDPSFWPSRNDALGNRSRLPGVRNPSQRAGSKPISHGPCSLDPLPLSPAKIVNTVAGRLSLAAERPTHPESLVSPSLIAKRPSRPPARGHIV